MDEAERRERLHHALNRGLLAFCLLLMGGIAWLDYATGKDLAVWALYLLPVGVVGWLMGFRSGFLLAFTAAVLIFVAGMLGGHRFSGYGWFLFAIANRFLALLAVAWLASRLYEKQMLESKLNAYEECLDYLHASPDKRDKVNRG